MSKVKFCEFMSGYGVDVIGYYSAALAVIRIADATVLKQPTTFAFMSTGVPIRGDMFLVAFLAIEF